MATEDLERLTIKKLREIALGIEEIKGVYGMSKEELIKAIREVRGEEPILIEREPPAKKLKTAVPKAELKHQVRELKKLREESIANKDSVQLTRHRKRIKKLKRMLRRAS